MKKIALIVAALLSATVVFAQTTGRERLDELEQMAESAKKVKSTENKLFKMSALNHFAFGRHWVPENELFADAFGPSKEIFFNIVKGSINPASWLSFDLGFDLKWDIFKALPENQFVLTDGNIDAIPNATFDDMESTFHTFGLTFPLTLSLHSKWIGLKLGAEAVINLNKHTYVESNYVDGATSFMATTRGGVVRRFSYDYMAVLTAFDGIGIYFKYYPLELVEGGKVSASQYFTVGCFLNFE